MLLLSSVLCKKELLVLVLVIAPAIATAKPKCPLLVSRTLPAGLPRDVRGCA